MARRNALVIDRRLSEELTGRDKLRALIVARFGTLQAFAGIHGVWPVRLSQVLSGDRRDPELRRKIAEGLGLPAEEVNELLDQPEDGRKN